MMRRSLLFVASAAALATALLYLPLPKAKGDSKASRVYQQFVQIPGAKPVGSETCAGCHTNTAKSFQHAFHQQQGVTCEDCHGNGSLHVDGGGDKGKIISLKSRSATEANGVCLSCHSQDEGARHWVTGVHAANNVRCIDCHQVHVAGVNAVQAKRANFDTSTAGAKNLNFVSPESNALVQSRAEANEACLRCHRTQGAQLSMPYHHPLREGKMSCADCHDPHGGKAGNNLRVANVNELCLGCHAQYRGPYAYQHPPVSENCMNCHNAHGSANTNLLTVSEPALCMQCHSGHHNGASLPLADRCTNCHTTIHGTDVATPSGGSRFIDKGQIGVPSEPTAQAIANAALAANTSPRATQNYSQAAGGSSALLASKLRPLTALSAIDAENDATDLDPGNVLSASSLAYRFLHSSGFAGRVGEYDSLQQSLGSNVTTAYVDPGKRLTLVSRGEVITGSDYSVRTQLTIGEMLKAGLDLRSLVQQQDHYRSYLAQLSPSDFGLPGAVTDAIPGNAVFAVTRRLGNGYASVKVPNSPVRLFVKGDMQARAGMTQLTYLDENSTPAAYVNGVNTTCGQLCHQASQYQAINYTTRTITGGAEVRIKEILHMVYEHTFSSFNDRLQFPIITYTGPFTPENEGYSIINPPPSGPAPQDVPVGSYYYDFPSPSQFSSDSARLNFAPNAALLINSDTTYTRLRNTFTHNPQNWFDTDDTASWTPQQKMRFTADYHQQNFINGFTPYYSLYGDVSYHRHWEGVQAEFELPAGFSLETRYKRGGITRSNSTLWPQLYSFDNTDLQMVIPSSTSDTFNLAVRYHGGPWNARVGYEWTGTNNPGYLIVPGSESRIVANVWFTPRPWFTFTNDTSIDAQNAFPSHALPNTAGTNQGFGGDISGLPPYYQRRNRVYTDAANVDLRPAQGWNLSLGYSYQQNNLNTYMAFQNDSSTNYVVDEPLVPYKQLSQVVWGDSTYTIKKRMGLEARFTHNASSSGFRPDLNANDAASLGNASLINQGVFAPAMFQSALNNLSLGATQISGVKVPQWMGDGKAYYLFPHRIEGGAVFHYGSYGDYWNPNLNGSLRTFDVYVGRTW